MKMTPRFLAVAVALASQQSLAADAFLHVFYKETPLQGIEVEFDGRRLGETDDRGSAETEIDAGSHTIELSREGNVISTVTFESAEDEDVEISVSFLDDSGEPRILVQKFGEGDASETGFLTGVVTDADGAVIPGAKVATVDGAVETTTNERGVYVLELPRGVHSVEISHPDYETASIDDIRVVAKLGVSVAVKMPAKTGSTVPGAPVIEAPQGLEEVLVMGTFNPTENAADIERLSTNITDAIDIGQLERYGDSDVAAAITRIVGVTVTEDKYANVRGLDGRYISSSLNGLLMPSTDPLRRDVQLDLFPSNIVGGIEIQKSYTPDLLGSTTGGSVKINTRGLPDQKIHKLSISTGYNFDFTGDDVSSHASSRTDGFGFDSDLRELPGSVYEATQGGLDFNVCVLEGQTDCVDPFDAAQLAITLQDDYNVRSKTANPDGSASYSYGDRVELENGDFGYYGALSYGHSTGDRGEAQLTNILETIGTYFRTKENTEVGAYFVTGYEFNAADEILSKTIYLKNTDDISRLEDTVDEVDNRRFRRAILEYVERQFISQQFSGLHEIEVGDVYHQLEWRVGYSETERYEPDRRSYTYENDNLVLSSLERRWSDLNEDSTDIGLDYTIPLDFSASLTTDLKIGAIWSDRSREVDLVRLGFRPGRYATAEDLNIGIDDNLEETLGYANIAQLRYQLRASTADTDSYTSDEEVAAAYITTTTEYRDFTFVLGARWEEFSQTLQYPNDPGAASELDSDDVLPAFNATYRLNDDIQFRAGFSQTVSYPGLIERSESQSFDPQTDDPIFGNPDLQVATIDNFDLRGEYYFSADESISLALFRKEIDLPVERAVPFGSGSAAAGITFRNEKSATLDGIELDIYKNLFDGENGLLFVAGNVSYIESEVELGADSIQLGGTNGRELQGQSPWLANLQFGVDHYPTEQKVTLLVNYFDDRIFRVTRGANVGPIIEVGRTLVDLNYEKLFGEALSLQVQLKNLLNEPVEYEQNGRVIESYEEGMSISVDLSYEFF